MVPFPYTSAETVCGNASDPWGLRPVTDADLQAHRDSNNGSLRNAASAGDQVGGRQLGVHGGGALIVGGIAMMATGSVARSGRR